MGDTVEWSGDAGTARPGYSVSASALSFQVQAEREAELSLLTSADLNAAPVFKINLQSNSKVVKNNIVLKQVSTPELLCGAEWRAFWVTWHRRRVRVGRAGQAVPFLDVRTPDVLQFRVVVPTVGAKWRFELGPVTRTAPARRVSGGEPAWLEPRGGQLPPGALVAGHEGAQLYVVRAPHRDSLTPGKFVTAEGTAYVSWGGQAHEKQEFEVLVGYNVEWVSSSQGHVPEGALPAGYSEGRGHETLYVGRAPHEGHLLVGKVQPSHGVLYAAYLGAEVAKSEYEVLVSCFEPDPRTVRFGNDRRNLRIEIQRMMDQERHYELEEDDEEDD